jgi:hypothetical protein
MIYLHITTGSEQVGTKVFCDSNTTVTAAGASNSDGQAGLSFLAITRQKEEKQILQFDEKSLVV